MSEKPRIITPEQLITPEFVPARFARQVFEQKESSRKNFFGLEEWDEFYREKGFELSALTDSQREIAEKFPGEWAAILGEKDPLHPGKEIRETHFAFLGIDKIGDEPLGILKWQKDLENGVEDGAMYQRETPRYPNEAFAKEPLSFCWRLMPLQILPKSENKTFTEQEAMLPADYQIPSAIEEVSKNLLYYRKNIAYLVGKDIDVALRELDCDKWGRTNTLASNGNHVRIGGFPFDGRIVVDGNWRDGRVPSLGLALSRKFKSEE